VYAFASTVINFACLLILNISGWTYRYSSLNHIDGVMVNVLASSVVDCGFEPWLGQTKDYKIGIYCFSAKHTALRRKSKYWWARNQDNVSEWSDMSIHRLLFQ
jgi:hypothetical protein